MGAKDIPQVDHHQLVLSENSRRIVLDARTYIREVSFKRKHQPMGLYRLYNIEY